MSAPADTVQVIQNALDPYIRPREETARIRRILAQNLRSCHENGPANGPLALAEPDCTLKTTDVRGLQQSYLKALHANVRAQREYESASQGQAGHEAKGARASGLTAVGRLEEHVASVRLRQKQARLQAVEKYLDSLGQKPAAAPEFLQEIFGGSRRLPDVPKTVVSSFTVDSSSTKTDLKALVDRLEKAVLRSKLLLRKEEQLLEQVKTRSTVSPRKISDGAKLAALNATRNELITWMETELGKASAVDEPSPEEVHGVRPKAGKMDMEEQLTLIKDKYADYVAARKSLIQLVAQSPQPSIRSAGNQEEDTQSAISSHPPPLPPSVHLLTPYIENLLSVAHEQKTSITQKSYVSNVLAKQTDDTGKALARLAEESLLLPEHPPRRHQQHLANDGGPHKSRGQEITTRVQPWVAAADAAKLATLETVAEKIEEGQVALENSMKHLAEIDQLLGRNVAMGDESVDEDSTAEDIWLAETQTPKERPNAPLKRNSDTLTEPKDVWSLLDGKLGLINAENSPRR